MNAGRASARPASGGSGTYFRFGTSRIGRYAARAVARTGGRLSKAVALACFFYSIGSIDRKVGRIAVQPARMRRVGEAKGVGCGRESMIAKTRTNKTYIQPPIRVKADGNTRLPLFVLSRSKPPLTHRRQQLARDHNSAIVAEARKKVHHWVITSSLIDISDDPLSVSAYRFSPSMSAIVSSLARSQVSGSSSSCLRACMAPRSRISSARCSGVIPWLDNHLSNKSIPSLFPFFTINSSVKP